MNITKIRAAFMLLDYDVSQDTDEDVTKCYEESLIGAAAQSIITVAEEIGAKIRFACYGNNGEIIGRSIRAILKQVEGKEE